MDIENPKGETWAAWCQTEGTQGALKAVMKRHDLATDMLMQKASVSTDPAVRAEHAHLVTVKMLVRALGGKV